MLNLIQVYAPTADQDENKMEEFYSQIHKILKVTKRGEINIVMRDWNAKVDEQVNEDVAGCFSLGSWNK